MNNRAKNNKIHISAPTKRTTYNKRYGERNILEGLCYFCKNKKLPNSKYCEDHFFKVLSRSRLGDRNKYILLKDLFYSQNKKCYLTGIDLTLGVNASLDHIRPIASHPELKNDINNVAFCDSCVNIMKGTLSINELKERCKLILK